MIDELEYTTGTHLAIQPKLFIEIFCVASFSPIRPTTWPFGLPLALFESFGRPLVSAAIAEYCSCVVATVTVGKEGCRQASDYLHQRVDQWTSPKSPKRLRVKRR